MALPVARLFLKSGRPQVVGVPTTAKLSLMVIGTPCSGPHGLPLASAARASRARASDSASSLMITALIFGSSRAMRAKHDFATSTAETFFLRIASAAAIAEAKARSSPGAAHKGMAAAAAAIKNSRRFISRSSRRIPSPLCRLDPLVLRHRVERSYTSNLLTSVNFSGRRLRRTQTHSANLYFIDPAQLEPQLLGSPSRP